ncbi:MAG: HlyD family secretion protein [Candidatus Symbiothrix sp.]|jgi:HlyD family secretion protein|nr:HlyD family secretion protein [Candidatus Symbiothrix sp.]
MNNKDDTHAASPPVGDLGGSGGFELRSEEMQDILARPPHILVRSGISVICSVILLLLIGSYFFKYPDIVTGEVVITTENPPVWMTAKTSGKMELNCKDKSPVQRGQVVAVIENPARTKDVNLVKELLGECRITDSLFFIPPGLVVQNYELGAIQNAWSAFLRTVTNYENFFSFNTLDREKEALKLQINGHRQYSLALQKQWRLKQEELRIAEAGYDRERLLFQKNIISQAEMEVAENALLGIRQSLQQIQTGMASDHIEATQLGESVTKLDTEYLKEKNSLASELKTAYSELLSAIENWEQVYLLISPIDGTVTFNAFWTSNQFVNAGDKVLAVVSHEPGEIIGRMQSPASGSGKIKPGQKVNIKVQGYPYMEYGALQGRVKNISLISNEKIYSVEVELSRGLQTNTGNILDFTGELNGDAEIITDDRSLLARILAPLKYLISKHIESN